MANLKRRAIIANRLSKFLYVAEDEGFIPFNLGNSPFFRLTDHKNENTRVMAELQPILEK